ncbi:hypothetical protein ACQEVF_57805 [Nonomuraea polychroma]|uniref:hypothetical protein n=1 Tax=Nonomuraea polychroma TaxID=46176 RepID=UPI003D8F9898
MGTYPYRINPHDLPRLRRQLISWLTDGRGYDFHLTQSKPGHDFPLGEDPAAWCRQLVDGEAYRLKNATLYHVSEKMTRFAQGAGQESGDGYVRPTPSMFPAPYGFMVFDVPIVEIVHRAPVEAILTVSPSGELDALEYNPGGTFVAPIVAVSWGLWSGLPHWPEWKAEGGVWFSFYIDRRVRIEDVGPTVRHIHLQSFAPLIPDKDSAVHFDAHLTAHPDQDLEWQEAAAEPAKYTFGWIRTVMTALQLMRQTRVVHTREQPIEPRQQRRALARAGMPTDPVRIVDARPVERRPHNPTSGQSGRKLQGTWYVNGFWRREHPNKKHPSGELIWIDAYYRGEGELMNPEKVKVWRS